MQISGTLTANNHAGAGTGLTGLALSLSVATSNRALTANYIDWNNVGNRPSVVSSDMTIASANYASTSNAVPWAGVQNKPTTILGYGITDAIITNNYAGNITLTGVITGGTYNGTHQGTWSGNTIAQSYLPATSISSNYNGALQISGTLTANSYAGAGTGLTGTALSLSVATANRALTANYIDWNNVGNRPSVVSSDMTIGLAVTASYASTANLAISMNAQGLLGAIKVLANGNVGISVTTPVTTLEVAGTVSASALVVNGGVNYFVSSVTDVSLTASHYAVFVNASAANRAVNLPSISSSVGRQYIVNKADNSSNVVNILPNGSETISGETRYVLRTRYEKVKLINSGSEWIVIGD